MGGWGGGGGGGEGSCDFACGSARAPACVVVYCVVL